MFEVWDRISSRQALCTPKGLQRIAQGRDRRERTLGHAASSASTLKGLHTRPTRVEPLQGSISAVTSTQGRLPLVANPGRCVATPSGYRGFLVAIRLPKSSETSEVCPRVLANVATSLPTRVGNDFHHRSCGPLIRSRWQHQQGVRRGR